VHNDRMRKRMGMMSSGYDDSAASPAFTLSALSVTVHSRPPACTARFSAKYRAIEMRATHAIRKPDAASALSASMQPPARSEQAQIRRRARERRLRFFCRACAHPRGRAVEALDRFAEPRTRVANEGSFAACTPSPCRAAPRDIRTAAVRERAIARHQIRPLDSLVLHRSAIARRGNAARAVLD